MAENARDDKLRREAADGQEEVRRRLRQRGAADHVVRGGAEYLISQWRDLIGRLEAGCPTCTLEEYFNGLDVRTLIHVAGLDARVANEDARFRSLLTGTDRRIWESDAPDPFWIYGYPKTAAGQLLEYLQGAGFAK